MPIGEPREVGTPGYALLGVYCSGIMEGGGSEEIHYSYIFATIPHFKAIAG